jgi:predicted enzyme related to lactoylglutathione lyase
MRTRRTAGQVPGLGGAIDAYASKIQSAGGKMLVPKTEVHGVGWLALFLDPDEPTLGVWQLKK